MADQVMEWEQTLDIPKGQGLPQGITADILGIEIGDTYTDAKAKLEAIAAEIPDGDESNLAEAESHFRLPIGTGNFVETKFVSEIKLTIAHDDPRSSEIITLYLSAPSSGAQVYGIVRTISYTDREGQIRISELMPRLSAKFGTEPYVSFSGSSGITYVYHFDEGQAVTHMDNLNECAPGWWLQAGQTEQTVEEINHSGRCDVLLTILMNYGISEDHARSVSFSLVDADRARANHKADFQFLRDYLDKLRAGTGGESPKL